MGPEHPQAPGYEARRLGAARGSTPSPAERSMADATCAAAVYTHLKEQRRRRSSPPAAVEHPSWAEGSASPGEQRPAKRAKRAKASAEDSLRIDPKLLREAGFDAGRKLEHRGDGALVRTHHGAKRDAKRDAKRAARRREAKGEAGGE